MKKVVSVLAIAALAAGAAINNVSAQTPDNRNAEREIENLRETFDTSRKRGLLRGYTNIAYVTQSMRTPGGFVLGRSDYGAALVTGRNFALHRRPIAGIVFLGLDASWLDLNYAHYKAVTGQEGRIHQADIGVGVGPAVHVFPVDRLGVHAYFKFHPTYATYFNDDLDVMGGFGWMCTSGGALSWGTISLGVEARWGKVKYKSLIGSTLDGLAEKSLREQYGDQLDLIPQADRDKYVDEYLRSIGVERTAPGKFKSVGARVYVSLRF